jgi:radical SAM protein with 4Fe4S-binding SPASM domain
MRAAQRKDRVHVIWHGGEPLVLSADYFWKAGETLDRLMPGHSESLQTSLLPLREDHLPWIKARLGASVGTSMDFTARTIKGEPLAYQELWMRKVDMCRKEGIMVIPGITPSRNEVPNASKIVAWMVDRGFERFNIERYNSYGFSAPDLPTNMEHSDFLIDLYADVMGRMESTGKAPMVRVLAAALGGVLHGAPGDRWGGSCASDFIVIEPDGSLNNCPDKTSKDEAYSNVEQGFEGFARSPQRRKWIRIQAIGHRGDHCLSCENNGWCKSGCPITCNDVSREGGECSGYKKFLNFVRASVNNEPGKSLAEAYLSAFAEQRIRANDPEST